MGNPLVAQAQSQTTGVTGIGIAESAVDLANGVKDGSWVEVGLGAVGVGMEALSMVVDPIGTLAQYGASWLIEHVQPLKEALDWLAGDPPVIQSFADTWGNVAGEVAAVAGDLRAEVTNGTAGWSGTGAEGYRGRVAEQTDALAGAATLADGISTGVMVMGQVVAMVRETVRDLVAELVGKLISWVLEEACTLGFATPLVAAQATTAITSTITKVSDLVRKLLKTIGNVTPKIRRIVDKLGEIIEKLAKLGKKFARRADGATTPSAAHSLDTPDVHSPDAPHAPDTPDGADLPGASHPGDGTTAGSSRPGDPAETKTPEDARVCENDPIDVATGEMVLGQTDVDLPGVLPLLLRRTHVSSYRAGRSYGRSWASTLDQRVEVDAAGVVYVAEDGMLLVYPAPPADGPVLPEMGPRWPLSRTVDGGFTVERGKTGQRLHFAPGTGLLREVRDRSGNRIEFDRDATGAPTAVRHSGGYELAVATDRGLITALSLQDEHGGEIPVVRYRYDDAGRLAEVLNSSGAALRFDYDLAGRITQWTDRNGEWYRYRYDERGRCVANEGSGGYLDGTFSYEDGITRFTDALGHTTVYRVNERRQIVAETDPLGHTTTQEWDEFDRLVSRTDPLGHTTTYRYDEDGNLTTITRPDGTQALAEYGELGRPVVTVDPDGAVWRRTYDDAGRVTTVTDPTGATTRCEYDGTGQLVKVTDELGRVHRTETDAAGLPVADIDVHGNVTRYRRDQFGRVVEITDPTGATTTLTWTVEGRLLSRTHPGGGVERWRYDGEGNQVEYVDALGQVTRVRTTHFDLPAAHVRPDGSSLTFAYDPTLKLRSVTDSRGQVWRYEYDDAGRLVAETDFNGRTVRYRHDAAGRLVARINGNQEEITYRRDRLGNVVERSHGDVVETFEHDPVGRLVRARNADADLLLTRDAVGRVLAEGSNGRFVVSEYDRIGRRTRRRTPTGAETVWRYGMGGRPDSLRTAGHTMTFGYDGAGRETERLLDSGTVIAQSWEPGGRLGTQTVSAVASARHRSRVIQQRRYHYRPDGHLAGVDDLLAGNRSFTLDPAARITAVTGAGWTERYAYDAAGNVTSASWPDPSGDAQGSRQYAGCAVTQAGNVRYRYDAQGRVISRSRKRLSAKPETWHYTWNADDRLVEVATPDGTRWRYLYDPLGRRIAKLRLAGSAVAERIDFCWDGMVLAEQIRSDGTATTWNWEPGTFRPVSQVERTARDQEWFDREFYSIVTDLVGTPSELVTPDGTLAWRRRSTLWGLDLPGGGDGADTPLRFPGQYYDRESGLHYNHHRYYDPATGRYTAIDPLGLAPAPNPQAYVPNPTSAIDPSGLTPCQTYYSVQSRQDADRLIDNGGEPWPSGVDSNGRPRSELGEGLYAWETREQAERYLGVMSSREGAPSMEIVEHRIRGEDFDGLRSADMSTMDDDAATELWLSEGNHDYDHIRRVTGRFGAEHYFSSSVYHLFQSTRSSG
ncbi:RHS repeat-associated protein [Amycolatopsis bartoniae]|uniref:Type IV secretion protein Rhs n=3 Tax=Amycolatopsis bartoniae TaxID=941986 RepID=A0A8H9ISU0_9PSEU|nr:DUF6531 domain-containing protein [Amycolatopsis bartoniae]MBB2934527.1 RHS repeat-associated protein [Amycolatopsis bartoniae]GHF46718.1 type IV secretion protein Rhs [Amycolatopsis bartoniae]